MKLPETLLNDTPYTRQPNYQNLCWLWVSSRVILGLAFCNPSCQGFVSNFWERGRRWWMWHLAMICDSHYPKDKQQATTSNSTTQPTRDISSSFLDKLVSLVSNPVKSLGGSEFWTSVSSRLASFFSSSDTKQVSCRTTCAENIWQSSPNLSMKSFTTSTIGFYKSWCFSLWYCLGME